MNVAQAIRALRDFASKVPDPIAPFLRFAPIPRVVELLCAPELEDYQTRSNQEWKDLIQAEAEPVRAAFLLRDWYNDQMAAEEKQQSTPDVLFGWDAGLKV